MSKKVSFVRKISKFAYGGLYVSIPKNLSEIFKHGDIIQVTIELLKSNRENTKKTSRKNEISHKKILEKSEIPEQKTPPKTFEEWLKRELGYE